MAMEQIAKRVHTLARFLGRRDVPKLTCDCLMERYGFPQADVMALFGGSVVEGGKVLADAMRAGVAKKYIIVGGAGHTTETLRKCMKSACPVIETEGRKEAEIFASYLKAYHGLVPDALECRSTNCGNNITYLLELLEERGFPHASIILCQDATMQLRMDAGARKYFPQGTTIINYAAYEQEVAADGGGLRYMRSVWGMWDMDRYLTLLMGEIPRLRDDAEGYGPNGKGYIAHIDLPADVIQAFEWLKEQHGNLVRPADERFRS